MPVRARALGHDDRRATRRVEVRPGDRALARSSVGCRRGVRERGEREGRVDGDIPASAVGVGQRRLLRGAAGGRKGERTTTSDAPCTLREPDLDPDVVDGDVLDGREERHGGDVLALLGARAHLDVLGKREVVPDRERVVPPAEERVPRLELEDGRLAALLAVAREDGLVRGRGGRRRRGAEARGRDVADDVVEVGVVRRGRELERERRDGRHVLAAVHDGLLVVDAGKLAHEPACERSLSQYEAREHS